jgi:hypothetical protein
MSKKTIATPDVLSLLLTIRGQRVILASDLAKIYGVQTKRRNEQIRRNKERFPSDFMFQLTVAELDEVEALRSQIATLKQGQHQKYRPFAFTEHGALMAANVLNSPQAVTMSVYVIRAFIQQREVLTVNAEIFKRLADIDKTLLQHNAGLRDIYQKLMPLLHPPPDPPRPKIGFRETRARYGLRAT